MSRVRYLADNDLTDVLVEGFRRVCTGGEFIRVRELELERLPDAEILEFAAANGYLVVSHDVSTMSAAAIKRIQAGAPMTGLFLVSQTALVKPVLDSLELVWSASEAEEWHASRLLTPYLARRGP